MTGGEAAGCKAYDALIGLPENKPDALPADKGYDADAIRADLAERKIEAVIPGRSNRRVKIEYDRALYKQRNHVERMFGHLKINRAIATRYDQLANSFLSMVYIATARYCLKFVHAAWRPLAISRLPKPRSAITPSSTTGPWLHNLNRIAPANPGRFKAM